MLNLCMFLFNILLFFVLTPGILLTIPSKSSKTTVALVHAVIFALVLHLTNKLVWNVTEAFTETSETPPPPTSNKLLDYVKYLNNYGDKTISSTIQKDFLQISTDLEILITSLNNIKSKDTNITTAAKKMAEILESGIFSM